MADANVCWQRSFFIFRCIHLLICLACCLIGPHAWAVNTINVYLEDDLIFSDKQSNTGFALEVLQLLEPRLQVNFQIHCFPLKRAQMLAMKDTESIILPVARTRLLESRFRWIGELMEMPVGFVQLEGMEPVTSYSQARLARGIGVLLGSPYEQMLIANNVPYVAMDNDELYQAFSSRKLSAILSAKPHVQAMWPKIQQPSKLVFGDDLSRISWWLAMNPKSRLMDAQIWELTIKELKTSKSYHQLVTKYFGL